MTTNYTQTITTTSTNSLAMRNPTLLETLDELATAKLEQSMGNRFVVNTSKSLGIVGLGAAVGCAVMSAPGASLALGVFGVGYGLSSLWESKTTGQTQALPWVNGLTVENMVGSIMARSSGTAARTLTDRDYLSAENKAALLLCSQLRPLALRYLDKADNNRQAERVFDGLVSQVVKQSKPHLLSDPDVALPMWYDPHFGRGLNAYMSYIEDRFLRSFAAEFGLATPADIPEPVEVETINDPQTITVETKQIAGQKNIAEKLGAVLKNTIIVGAQGSGKGFTVAHSVLAAMEFHPGVKFYFVDPKADGENYFSGIIPDERVFVKATPSASEIRDAEHTEADPVRAWLDSLWAFLTKFETDKNAVLIFDEMADIQDTVTKAEWIHLRRFANKAATKGRSSKRYIWQMTQSPNLEDLGLTGGKLKLYRKVALVLADQSNSDWDTSLLRSKTEFFEGAPTQAVLGDRMAYDSLTGGWFATIPLGPLPKADAAPVVVAEVQTVGEIEQAILDVFSKNPKDSFTDAEVKRKSNKLNNTLGISLELLRAELTRLVTLGKIKQTQDRYHLPV